ncbi:DUF5682 family protein [Dictyobacter arantiisoli]|uniref:Uncharacterized protein n=1 Tax=Dictyobacter arantiisoli TaxID=2014874 RepID=A0A5A5TCD1_9CHLR|nr:DUF5682 family protein [Dictyobacter arantiisoli]GCF08806.1 hypothetical protein KDI_23700 [Dictyobacter arantiisoli]
MTIHVFGIRHHGPGCARSLRAALLKLEPDILLIEGPPDAQDMLPFIQNPAMKPPVALLIYAPDQPAKAVYYPFTDYSPEWQALKYAHSANVPARFIDLPQAIQLAQVTHEEQDKEEPLAGSEGETESNPTNSDVLTLPQSGQSEEEQQIQLHDDPLSLLAQAAGYTDHELWWERQIEQRQDMVGFFESILEAMTELRINRPPKDEHEAQREASMRQNIRVAQREGFQRIAVVCGAWHAPVLVDPGPDKADAELLHGLKRIKVASTWIPWTNSRLAYRSGYGAGVEAPGWYAHLWSVKDRNAIRWITKAARLLRKNDLDASSASVIEAVRLSEALSAMRDLTQPGLAEHNEAIQTVLCHGDSAPMDLIRTKMEIGEKLGQVPQDVPAVPLQHDLEQLQRRLRLKPSAEHKQLELDLREKNERARSQLLHRLHLLGIPWGEIMPVRNKKGTFWEYWQLQWKVEFSLTIIEANIWGNTIETATTAYLNDAASKQPELPQLTHLLKGALLAELPVAIAQLLKEIQKRATITADVRHLMDALPPLAQIARYSDVRQTRAEDILPIIDGLFERSLIGLPGACASLDDEAAAGMLTSIDHVMESIQLLDLAEQRTHWNRTLRRIAESENIHGLVRGHCCRLLLDQQALNNDEIQNLINLALASAVPTAQAAAWIEGILHGNGVRILHQDNLWLALDRWQSELAADTFTALLPILRRAFANFQPPERRQMGEKVKRLHQPASQRITGASGQGPILHPAHADLVLPLLAQIMGVSYGN